MTPDTEPAAQRQLWAERAGREFLATLQAQADRSAAGRFGFEFLMFGLKQAWACCSAARSSPCCWARTSPGQHMLR